MSLNNVWCIENITDRSNLVYPARDAIKHGVPDAEWIVYNWGVPWTEWVTFVDHSDALQFLKRITGGATRSTSDG